MTENDALLLVASFWKTALRLPEYEGEHVEFANLQSSNEPLHREPPLCSEAHVYKALFSQDGGKADRVVFRVSRLC